jgi:lipoprotein NlpD
MINMTNYADCNKNNVAITFFKRKLVLLSVKFCLLSAVCLLFIGCSTTQPPVPVVDRVKNQAPETAKPRDSDTADGQVYTVQKGDTLYAIALNHGVDYKKLDESKPTLYAVPQQPVTTTLEPDVRQSELPQATDQENATNPTVSNDKLKTSPKAIKLPYSEQNAARLQHPPTNLSPGVTAAASPTVGSNNAKIEFEPQPKDKTNQSIADWMWPTNGKLLSAFSKNSKGVKISGQAGQPIVASAAGVVVYSGNGLRGYGNLIIIKHDDTYLSAYAHNNKLLVKEGEAVVKGQKIAEMGNTDSDTIQLHFEIRKNSKPVDPLEYLPQQS